MSGDLLDAVLDGVADAIYLVGTRGEVRLDQARRPRRARLRPSGGRLIGRDSHATIHHSRADGTPYPAEECPLLRARTTGQTVRVEQDWFVRRDGSMVPVAYSSAPLETAEGRSAVVVFRDISERLESEAAHARAIAEEARAEEIAALTRAAGQHRGRGAPEDRARPSTTARSSGSCRR